MTRVTQDKLVREIDNAAAGTARLIVAVAGPPGAGKSTLAETLLATLDEAALIAMDGFHLDNEALQTRGLLHRKGAPETFDVKGFTFLIEQVRNGEDVTVPKFDRDRDCVVPDGGRIDAGCRIVIVEGNYLLLDTPGWRDLHQFWDMSVMLDVPEAELERRLVQRWLDHGLSPADATRRAGENDMINARTVRDRSVGATFTV